MKSRTALIDLSAIAHNYSIIKSLAPKSQVLAMVKSDAYGHGLLPVAKALPMCDAFGVSVFEEALALRVNGITQRIVLMTGFSDFQELELCVQHDIDVVVHIREHLDLLRQLNADAQVSVWLKLDIAMHRLGFRAEDFSSVYDELCSISAVRKPIIVMSHLPNADNLGDDSTSEHIHQIINAVQGIDAPMSIAKSAAILGYPETHQNWIRPGIMLYGISPFPGHVGAQHRLQPAMNFTAKVIALRQLKAGEPVSYGGVWRCPEDMTIAVVGVGYSDGYPRHAKSGTPVLIRGKTCKLVGRVCMDMMMVDCRHCPDIQIGDEALLWGVDLPIERIAECSETIAYELACHVSDRVKTYQEK